MKTLAFTVLVCFLCVAPAVQAGEERTFEVGSLIIPMDLAYQDEGIFQAYGLLFQLLRQGITVYWVIDLEKEWHHSDCDTPDEECDWDCKEEGTGDKCPYPTASPDFYAGATVLWDSEGLLDPGHVITNHGYRGGPFLIDKDDREAALLIIDVWNDPETWDDNLWAQRTEFHVVSVHQSTTEITGYVRKKMVAAPTIAVFSDGNEDIATGYLRAAGIPQSNGFEFPEGKCGNDDCGPGTDNPDMLTVVSIMGDMGTCDNPNYDHKNGALFTEDGIPAYCQIMSMHWGVNDRETVECDGGRCPDTQAECNGETFTYHGHEVVAEVRQFLYYPVHFFAECQAVNAYENTVPNPDWPFLDDGDRLGHYLTDQGEPPDCQPGTCTDDAFECIIEWCDDGVRDCCQSKNAKEVGAGFMIGDQPASDNLLILHPEVPYNQMDGAFGTVGGSEPAYSLADFLGVGYKKAMEVTFITKKPEAEEDDVWMTGYLDGECNITDPFLGGPVVCESGKVSYLGGHRYQTDVPLSGSPTSQGTRLFLNALFEADCVTTSGQPDIMLAIEGEATLVAPSLPARSTYQATYANLGAGAALDAVLTAVTPDGASLISFEPDGTQSGADVSWTIGSIGSFVPRPGDPANQGSRWAEVEFPQYGTYQFTVQMEYRVGVSVLQAPVATYSVEVVQEAPDGGPDAGTDGSGGDGVITDGGADASGGDDDGTGSGDDCGCASGSPSGFWLVGLLFLALRRRNNQPA
jgi:MYXO-CTERM domain-containing protein